MTNTSVAASRRRSRAQPQTHAGQFTGRTRRRWAPGPHRQADVSQPFRTPGGLPLEAICDSWGTQEAQATPVTRVEAQTAGPVTPRRSQPRRFAAEGHAIPANDGRLPSGSRRGHDLQARPWRTGRIRRMPPRASMAARSAGKARPGPQDPWFPELPVHRSWGHVIPGQATDRSLDRRWTGAIQVSCGKRPRSSGLAPWIPPCARARGA
jgi:hypothetical protein